MRIVPILSLHVEPSDPEMEITGDWADVLGVNT
jgi:hypothetical protein